MVSVHYNEICASSCATWSHDIQGEFVSFHTIKHKLKDVGI